jgi:hypothetical protein
MVEVTCSYRLGGILYTFRDIHVSAAFLSSVKLLYNGSI